jgi:hypothetical protein
METKDCMNIKLKDQSGTALVIALIMIALLSLIGSASMFTSTIEISLSGNKRGKAASYIDTHISNPLMQTQYRHPAFFELDPSLTIDGTTTVITDSLHSPNIPPDLRDQPPIYYTFTLNQIQLPCGTSVQTSDGTTNRITIYYLGSRGSGSGLGDSGGFIHSVCIIDTIGEDNVASVPFRAQTKIREKLVLYEMKEGL